MGEAKRKKDLGLYSRNVYKKVDIDNSPRLIEWIPITVNQKDKFIKFQ